MKFMYRLKLLYVAEVSSEEAVEVAAEVVVAAVLAAHEVANME